MDVLVQQADNPKTSSEENRIMAQKLVSEAKVFASDGELYKSLRLFKKAYKIFPTEKIQSRIERIKEAIEEDEEEDENFGFIELDNGLVIFKKLVERLYPHQIEGVKWLYDLFQAKKKGGILADDMGLGKTIQIISFISAMFDMQLIKNILLVLPLSVIPTWLREFKDWAPGIKIECFHGPASKRMGILRQCMMKRSVCITTYGLIITQWQSLSESIHGREFVWDYIILDEGHRIKRPSKTTKRLHGIPSRNRIILTGTPIQNRMRDMWALMDWVTQGALLGTQKTFKASYEMPIEKARQKDANAPEIQLGNHMAESLRKLTQPYILRRTKSELMMEDKENLSELKKLADDNQDKDMVNKQPSFPKLLAKNDFVVWVYLSPTQEKIYRDFVQLDSVKDLLSSHRSPLVYLTVLKKICDHPRLLSTKACLELGMQSNNNSSSDELESQEYEDCAANRIDNISDEVLINESAKLEFLIQLLLRLREEGHRTLVFSLSRKMLNIIQRILINHKFKVMRLDGLVTKLKEREKRVDLFQKDDSYNVFLLTTQVGGVGLTLTGADRAIIYDPSWNPATDAQSVDRIYRIGQKKSVVVYRLITCGTVEEKIYRRQIYKNSFIEQSTCGHKDPYRYFSRQDLAELFILDDPKSSATQQQLEKLHAHQRNFDPVLQEHVGYLHTLKMYGLSDHDLMFSRKPDDFDYERQMSGNDFNNKVQEAQNRLRIESDQLTGFNEAELRWGGGIAQGARSTNQNKKDEPIYPIEGLSQQMDALSLPIKTELCNSSTDGSDQGSFMGRGYDASGYFEDKDAMENSDEDKNERTKFGDGTEEKSSSHILGPTLLTHEPSPSTSKNSSPEHELNLRLSSDNDDLIIISDSPSSTRSRKSMDDTPTTSFIHNGKTMDDTPTTSFTHHGESTEDTPTTSFTHHGESTEDAPTTSFTHHGESTEDAPTTSFTHHGESTEDAPTTSFTHNGESTEDIPSTSAGIHLNECTSDDELILAVDSPLFQNNRSGPSIKVTASNKESQFPTEIQDSFTIFSDSGSDAEDLDESWKTAFSRAPPVLSDTSKIISSESDTPFVTPFRKTRRIIESDDSDNESLLQLRDTSLQLNHGLQQHPNLSANLTQSSNRSLDSRLSVASDSRNSSVNASFVRSGDDDGSVSDGDDTDLDESNKDDVSDLRDDDTDLDESNKDDVSDLSDDDTDLDDTEDYNLNRSILNEFQNSEEKEDDRYISDDLPQLGNNSCSTDQPFSLHLSNDDDEI